MPLRIRLSGTEAAKVRFAVSPLTETVLAVRALVRPAAHPVHARWRRRTAFAPDPELAELVAGPVPSFLMNVPPGPSAGIGAELARLRAMPPAFVTSELAKAGVRARPAGELLKRVAEELERCHAALIAPLMDRLGAVLDADVDRQARRLAAGGVAGMLAHLHTQVAWSGGELVVSRCAGDDTVELEGRGLVLTPSVFTWPDVLVDRSPLEAGWLVYPAGGAGRLWDDTPSAPEGLTAVLGRTRAALLEALSEPLSTGDLASRLAVTPGAVSQHLTALRAAGLVTTRRAGRTATHTRTDLATGLITASPSTAPLRP
ncbi:DUF5937 family protein [Nonomuraea sp. NPDC005692]|uniref:ArsR/SmtB family transcription factor n=1 Tax=Nonomuraea sp. NPDC005692 TaxID=3157168 RepID=UPI0033CAB860